MDFKKVYAYAPKTRKVTTEPLSEVNILNISVSLAMRRVGTHIKDYSSLIETIPQPISIKRCQQVISL